MTSPGKGPWYPRVSSSYRPPECPASVGYDQPNMGTLVGRGTTTCLNLDFGLCHCALGLYAWAFGSSSDELAFLLLCQYLGGQFVPLCLGRIGKVYYNFVAK
jgi:hypothetical protein